MPRKSEGTVWQDDIPGSKYIVFMFRTSCWSGELKSSEEGRMEWMTLDEMRAGRMAPHMEEYLRVLLEDDVSQAYGISGSNHLDVIKSQEGKMAKAKNSKKKSGIKTIRRDVMIPPMFRRRMADDFIDMCSMYWKMADNGSTPAEGRPGLLQCIIGFCEDAWNVGILAKDMKQASQLLARNYPASNPAFRLVYNMVTFKRENFPADRAIVKNASGSFGSDGQPAIDFTFDYGIMEDEARSRQKTIPKLEDIIDQEALERATAGLPADKVMDALNAELNRQMEIYNNTPQAELGGKSPNQMANELH